MFRALEHSGGRLLNTALKMSGVEDVAVGTVDTLDVSDMQDTPAIWRSESETIH